MPMPEPDDPQENRPNLYEFDGHGVRVRYATTSLNGLPRFCYHERGVDEEFTGNQIRIEPTGLGSEVTVVLESTADLETVTVTLLIPEINMDATPAIEFGTVAIRTTNHTSIDGPGMVHGPLQTYRSVELRGTAKIAIP